MVADLKDRKAESSFFVFVFVFYVILIFKANNLLGGSRLIRL